MKTIHAEVNGGESSPPLVLIHGAGGNRLHWPPVVRRLPGAQVYSLDLPGHGQSPGPAPTSIEDYADVVLAWMGLNVEREPVVVGHSMGSAIALSLALHTPDRLAGMALVGSGARLRVHPSILSGSSNEETFPAVVDQIMEWAFSPQAPPRLVQLARRRMLEVPPAVLNSDFQACDNFDIMAELEGIETPALILCGSQDMLTPLKYSEFLAAHLPKAHLETIPDAGHMVMLEQPQAVAAVLASFLRRTMLSRDPRLTD